MDKLVEKHNINCQKMDCKEAKAVHASITKEIAIGFAKWLNEEYPCKFYDKYGKHNSTEYFTLEELFYIYIKTLNK